MNRHKNYHTAFHYYLLFMFSMITCTIKSTDRNASQSANSADRVACLEKLALRCPQFWGLTKAALGQDSLVRFRVLSQVPGVLKSCPELSCVPVVATKFETCVASGVLADALFKHPDPSLNLKVQANILGRLFERVTQTCKKED